MENDSNNRSVESDVGMILSLTVMANDYTTTDSTNSILSHDNTHNNTHTNNNNSNNNNSNNNGDTYNYNHSHAHHSKNKNSSLPDQKKEEQNMLPDVK